jgi:hypothetical protein
MRRNPLKERDDRLPDFLVFYLGKRAHDANSRSALQELQARIYILHFIAAPSRALEKERHRHIERVGNQRNNHSDLDHTINRHSAKIPLLQRTNSAVLGSEPDTAWMLRDRRD